MDLANAYANLPGIRTQTSFDFVKKVAASTASTQAVLVIGTARDGTDELVRLTSTALGFNQYGAMSDANNESERRSHLVRGIAEVSDAGCNDIWCLRIGGTKASLNPTYTDNDQEKINNIKKKLSTYQIWVSYGRIETNINNNEIEGVKTTKKEVSEAFNALTDKKNKRKTLLHKL